MLGFEPLYLVYGILAFIPALIWLSFLLTKHKNRKLQIILFLLGACSVAPIFFIEYLFQLFPKFDFITIADQQIVNPNLHFLLIYSWVGISEELIKQWMLRFLDSKFLLVETINDSIKLSLIAALGFSFAENIFYFYQIGTHFGLGPLFVSFLFRSIFTTCAHLVFSGFFGYFYGLAKFSISIVEQSIEQGKKFFFSRFLARLFNMSKIQAYQEATILKGLFIAIAMHAFFDYTLQMNGSTGNPIYIVIAAIFIIASYSLLRHMLKNRAGKLILIQDSNDGHPSTMAQTDEGVVVELLGMWFNKGKFVDVIHICERLLKRDPGNKVVQIFKAKAMDKMNPNNPYKLILSKLFPNQDNSNQSK
jgi:RsiW-degrading membrane proteinase PrsW (M82 family)